jgi:hypothetical protein
MATETSQTSLNIVVRGPPYEHFTDHKLAYDYLCSTRSQAEAGSRFAPKCFETSPPYRAGQLGRAVERATGS